MPHVEGLPQRDDDAVAGTLSQGLPDGGAPTGLVTDEMFRRSGSVWPGVVVHAVVNLPTVPALVLAGAAWPVPPPLCSTHPQTKEDPPCRT